MYKLYRYECRYLVEPFSVLKRIWLDIFVNNIRPSFVFLILEYNNILWIFQYIVQTFKLFFIRHMFHFVSGKLLKIKRTYYHNSISFSGEIKNICLKLRNLILRHQLLEQRYSEYIIWYYLTCFWIFTHFFYRILSKFWNSYRLYMSGWCVLRLKTNWVFLMLLITQGL